MTKSTTPHLEDILASLEKITEYLQEIDFQKELFFQDTEKQDAVIRRLEIIGEATKRLHSEYRQQHPKFPGKECLECGMF